MANSFYNEEELKKLGFKTLGKNVLISKKASIYGAQNISIGNNVRIDDFCILSGKIVIGDFIHISAYTSFFAGDEAIILDDFVTVSSRCAIYSKSDDYSGEFMTNPMVPENLIGVVNKKVILNKHVIIGSGSTILPGVEIGIGTAVGSMSLVNKSLEGWGIYAGIPCKLIKQRSKRLLELEKQLIAQDSWDGKKASYTIRT